MLLFQLHHTGIKTRLVRGIQLIPDDFNCTIQELKQQLSAIDNALIEHFNCTIQELKPEKDAKVRNCTMNFNCTIQELKPQNRV